mmetsp:Transcript_12917/g.25253  ORF Transcript_12917/g.25253 Transcript_12917/m.25253 type:complete len:327 (-) Transcript_12917:1631-2611(-)
MGLAPLPGILEHADPGGHPGRVPGVQALCPPAGHLPVCPLLSLYPHPPVLRQNLIRHMRPLPGQHTPLGVGHQAQMPPVCRAHACNSPLRPIRVERILLCHLTVVVYVAEGDLLGFFQFGDGRGALGEEGLSLSVGTPHRQHCPLHPSQHDGLRFLNLQTTPPAFKPSTFIPHKPRLHTILPLLWFLVPPRYPPEKCHQLAPIAHTQGEGIGTGGKVGERISDLRVESNRGSPTFGGIANVGIRKTTHKDHPPKIGETSFLVNQIRHRHIIRSEPCEMERSGHFTIPVAPLFPHNRHPDLLTRAQHCLWSGTVVKADLDLRVARST